MNLPKFDRIEYDGLKIINFSKVEEAKRLANELRSTEKKIIQADGFRYLNDIIIPAVKGFDVETCSLLDITKYIKTHPKISQSLLMFLYRIMAVRFPTDFKIMKKTSPHKLEMELIESEAKNDIAWLGEVGFQNSVRLDNSLTIPSVKVIKEKNDKLRIEKNGN
jgi:hypothetical protein